MNVGNATLEQVVEALDAHERFALCGHLSPDGDCLGSQLALAAALRAKGKQVTCLLARDEPVDAGLRFLPGLDEFVPAGGFDGDIDVFVSVDLPSPMRMGDGGHVFKEAPFTIMIDHHNPEDPVADLSYIDPDSPACALIVWELIEAMGVARDEAMATACYTGLATDTGRFQYQNTTPECFQGAASMVACGANPAEVAMHVYQSRSRASLALEARMIDHIEMLGGGTFATSYLLRSDFVETGASKADAEPCIDLLRSIEGVRVACILRQLEEGVRGSLRAKDDTDVAAIAARFGGGGHRAAAGFTSGGTIEHVRESMRQELRSLE